MTTKRPRRLATVGTAALLVLTLIVPAAVTAAPAQPTFVITDQTDQAGTFDPSHGTFNSAWFSASIYNGTIVDGVATPGTSTYTQMHLVVAPSDSSVVARAALDGTAQVPTASSLCTQSGNTFDCVWPTNLGGGESTSPITFIFASPSGNDFDVTATFTTKDHTTTSGGGSGQDRDVTETETISVDVSDRIDAQTPYLLSTSSTITISTWKKNGVAAVTLPASPTGYLVDLEELTETPTLEGCDLDAGGFDGANTAKAFINNGATISPYVQWKVSVIWDTAVDGPAPTLTGIIHCVDNGDGTFTSYELTLPDNACSVTGLGAHGCIVSLSTKTKGSKGAAVVTYTMTFRTPSNGYTKPK